MRLEDALLTIAHQANEHRIMTMRLEQAIQQAQTFATERDQARTELASERSKQAAVLDEPAQG